MDRGAWRAAVHGVAKSWTWLSSWTEQYDLQSTLEHSRLLIFVFNFSRSYKTKIWEMPRQSKGFTCLKSTVETFYIFKAEVFVKTIEKMYICVEQSTWAVGLDSRRVCPCALALWELSNGEKLDPWVVTVRNGSAQTVLPSCCFAVFLTLSLLWPHRLCFLPHSVYSHESQLIKGQGSAMTQGQIASTDCLCLDTCLNGGQMTLATPLGHTSNEGDRCRNLHFQMESLWDIAVLIQAYCWLEVLTPWQRWGSPHRCLQSDQQSETRGGGRSARSTEDWLHGVGGGRSPGGNDLATQSLRLMRAKPRELTRENWFVQTGLELGNSTLVSALEFSLGQEL